MNQTNLIIGLLIVLVILKLFIFKEKFGLTQERCTTISDPTECRMSGCVVGRHNTCMTPGQESKAFEAGRL
jgi:hypothetical protein